MKCCKLHYLDNGAGIFPCTLDDIAESRNHRMQKQKRMEAIHLFLSWINALLNSTIGGKIIVHVKDCQLTEVFHQKVCDKLVSMIPDNSLFASVYQEEFLDEHHLLFTVSGHTQQRPYSVLDFRTKIAVCKGLETPTHGQMAAFVRMILREPAVTTPETFFDETNFKEGEEVILRRRFSPPNLGSATEVPLTEGTCVCAKAFCLGNRKSLPEYCAERSKHYISAFSKSVNGGTIYFGIKEKMIGNRQYKLVVQGDFLNGPMKEDVEKTIASIREEIRKSLRWIGMKRPSDDQITVRERRVGERDGKEVYVVEIKVKYYHGLCFYDLDGPLLFKGDFATGLLRVNKLGVYDWLGEYEGATEKLRYDSHSTIRACSSGSSDSQPSYPQPPS
jgi:hypothetical protein